MPAPRPPITTSFDAVSYDSIRIEFGKGGDSL